ncbi:MAG: hypothetical protein R3304_07265 [Longimicrobiales bacterium]|nr:hypothetical protein [Longimicrobiales bacterium]
MSPKVKTALTVVGAVAVGLLILAGAQRILERQQTLAEIERLREELYRSRLASDRCLAALETSEAALRGLRTTIDSLRLEVGGYETASGRVPQALYDDYMGVFDEYNDSVGIWEGRERRLRTAEASCRATIERHNALGDSLRAILSEEGIETG